MPIRIVLILSFALFLALPLSSGYSQARGKLGDLTGTFEEASADTGPVELLRVRDSESLTPADSELSLSTQQWREDLEYFAREMPKRHANAFHFISRERFEAEVAKLNGELEHLSGDEVYFRMDAIANLIGDGHTYINFPADTATFPLILNRTDDEYRVASVAPGLESALGARVARIEGVPVERAAEIVSALTPQDETPVLRQVRTTSFLRLGMVLHGARIIPDRNTAHYTLTGDNGKEFTVEVHSMTPGATEKWVSASKELPLFRQRPDQTFWYIYLPDQRSVYCSFRGYGSLGSNAEGLLKLLDQQHPDKLIIDMRQNGGGDYTQGLKHLIHPIRDLPSINAKGHLFVIIGPNTFSAAMANAAQFRAETAAILVGLPIGEKPNSYQEPRQMTLPNSHLVVRYSTRFYKFVENGENIVRPDQEIKTSWADFTKGQDPVLEWVFSQSTGPNN